MVEELITFPIRVGLHATRVAVRTGLHASERALSVASLVVKTATSAAPRRGRTPDFGERNGGGARGTAYPQRDAEQRRESTASTESAASTSSRASAAPGATQTPSETTSPPRPDTPEIHLDAAPTPLVDEPARVSEEPSLVEEFAEPGAEDGAGAEVHIAEPWDGYSKMNAQHVIARIRAATEAELAAVQLYEGANRGRESVLAAVTRELRSKSGRAAAVNQTRKEHQPNGG